MAKQLRVLIAEDYSDKVSYIKSILERLAGNIDSAIEFSFIVVDSTTAYKKIGSPVDFDLAFIDLYLSTKDMPSMVRERQENLGHVPAMYVGASIVDNIRTNNIDLYNSTFSISADKEGVPNIQKENILKGLNSDEFQLKVMPEVERIIGNELRFK